MSNPATALSKSQINQMFPQVADRYVLSGRKPIGAVSGFGAVWKAHDKWLQRDIAIKFSDRDMSEELKLCRDIEGQTVRIFDYFRAENGWNAYAMELLDAPWISISQFIQEHTYRQNDLQHYFDCFEIARSILNGLSHIHGRPYSREGRFVHADIKPDNLFVLISPKKQAYSVFRMPEKGNLVKIIDMGISTESGFTLPGCTPAYSPINKSKARPGVDLYALAICFLELLHGIRPDHNILGHKARIRAFVARRSSGSDFVDELAVEFASRCARAATQSVVSPHRLLDWLHGALFASNILSLIVLHTINKKLSTGLRKDDLADFLFDTFAVYHDWQNKTKVRVGYIKEFIKDLYDTEFLVLTGHSYFIRSC